MPLVAILLASPSLAGCSGDDSGPAGHRAAACEGLHGLAVESCIALAGYSSVRMATRTDTEHAGCTVEVESAHTLDGSRGWVDVDRDGTVDGWLAEGRILVRPAAVPGWSVDATWVELPADFEDPRTALAAHSGLEGIVRAFLEPERTSFLVAQVEGIAAPATFRRDGVDDATGFDRWVANDPGSEFAVATALVDGSTPMALELSKRPDVDGPAAMRWDLLAVDEEVVVDLPPGDDVVPFDEVRAVDVVLTLAWSDTVPADPCSPSAGSPDADDPHVACVRREARDDTVADYLRLGDPHHAYACGALG